MDIDDDLSFFTLRTAQILVALLVGIFAFDFLLFPLPLLAADMNHSDNTDLIEFIKDDNKLIQPEFNNSFPENVDSPVSFTRKYVITAYNSEVGQCDNTPCVAANGFNVCEHGIEDSVATNMFNFGTKIRIPELFGDRVFVVRDRMNKRYTNRIDVWMKKKSHAKMLGVQYANVEVLD